MCVTNNRRRPKSLLLSAGYLAKGRSAGEAAASYGHQWTGSLFSSDYVPSSSAGTFPANGGAQQAQAKRDSPNGCDGGHGGGPLHGGRLEPTVASSVAAILPVAASSSPTSVSSEHQSQQQQQSQAAPEGTYVQGVYIPLPKPQPKRIRKPQKPGKTAKMNERHFVKHDYHDHAHDVGVEPEPSVEAIAAAVLGQSRYCGDSTSSKKKPAARRGRGISVSFPRKLHFLLDQIEADGLAHVISWLPHGRAFAVHKPRIFVEDVMPKYFKQTKLTSFQRQLNLYGFARLTRGRDNGGYYNEFFLRGKPFLTRHMVRTRVKGTKFKAASSPESEPNFYTMDPVSLPEAAATGTSGCYPPVVSAPVPPAPVSEDEKTFSASGTSSGSNGSDGSMHAPPSQMIVTVPSFDALMSADAPVSPIRCSAGGGIGGSLPPIAMGGVDSILEQMATMPMPLPSPSLLLLSPGTSSAPSSVRTAVRVHPGRSLWDCLENSDPHMSTPVPPNLMDGSTAGAAAPWLQQQPAATHDGATMEASSPPPRHYYHPHPHPAAPAAAIVSAPPSRRESGAEEEAAYDEEAATFHDLFSTLNGRPSPSVVYPNGGRHAAAAPRAAEGMVVTEEVVEEEEEDVVVDPLMDLVQDWISEDALEQAVGNDADFGRMLEMIAE